MTADLSDRQSAASRQGRAFEDTVAVLLQVEGWTILDRHYKHPTALVEIDFVATDPTGQEWWIECKGSWESKDNGLERTDTLKKAIGSASTLRLLAERDRRPYMIVTSHIPHAKRSGATWIRNVLGPYVDEIRMVGFIDTLRPDEDRR